MALPTTAAPGSSAVYWVGQNGDVYLNAAGVSGGVQDEGKALDPAILPGSFASTAGGKQYGGKATEIADPDPGGKSAATNNTAPANSNGTSTASTYQDKSGDIAEQNSGLSALSAQPGIDKINSALSGIVGQYEGDLTDANTNYTTSSNDNQNDLQSNKETALQDAVQGRQGLYGTLASLGALNGSGLTLANNAVAKGANEDLNTASDNYATNQSGLDTTYKKYKTDTTNAENTAKSAAANDIEQVQNDTDKAQQTYLNNIANDYADEGNTAQSKAYMDRASALFPEINNTNVPTIDLGYSGSAYTAPSLSQYVGQANNTTVQPTTNQGGGGLVVPGLVATNKKQSS